MKYKCVSVRLPKDVYENLATLATQRQEPVGALARRLLTQVLAEESAANGRDVICSAVRSSMREVMGPVEDRMAKLSAKATMAAATSMFLNVQCIADLGKNNAVELYNDARSKAAVYMRGKADEE
ncbi:hypothetical protein [Tepidanaerobacter acetatoxydans]|uniref:hypothetical protein n=1 Tax=Tepidanaerobacter acetatoxydans TaxID=499229 RepID=UPI001BD2A8E2|nr:hypothetical protein [Tepidanaerobacter acetatoxydans]